MGRRKSKRKRLDMGKMKRGQKWSGREQRMEERMNGVEWGVSPPFKTIRVELSRGLTSTNSVDRIPTVN